MPEAVALVHRVVAARAGEPPHPTLLLLHGRGSNELDLLSLAEVVDPRFFVVSARAPRRFYEGYAWYDLKAPGRYDPISFQESLGLLRSFLEQLPSHYPVDPAGVIPFGFSQGAMMSNALTLTAPDRIAGAVLLSGFQPTLEDLELHREAIRGKPFFVAHGLYDDILEVERGRGVRDTLTSLAVDLTYREYPMGHQVVPEELAEIKTWLVQRLPAD